jgi:MazG family protein
VERKESQFNRLISIMKRLRAPDGCPWDRKQTWKSLCPHIVEEAFELIDAIQNCTSPAGRQHVLEECGDLLLQVIFVGTIAEEQGAFDIEQIPQAISDKLVRRHPHIFGGSERTQDADQAYRGWEEIKRRERASHHEDTSVLAGVPRSLPAVVKAYRIQQKAASVGFDWQKDSQEPVMEKIREELGEVRQAMEEPSLQGELAGEIGDLLFAVVNLARRCNIDPESALALTNSKFDRRFRFVEEQVEKSGRDWQGLSLDELESFWNRAKRAGL